MEFIREDCIYARQSVDRKDSISIESQIDFCKYELKGGSCRVFKDKGYSGKNTDRPEFQKLLGEIRKGKVRRVIVYKLDRISRSILDFATMMELFQEYDVEFVSSTEKFDTSTPMGRAMLNICIVFAQLERETTAALLSAVYRNGKNRCDRWCCQWTVLLSQGGAGSRHRTGTDRPQYDEPETKMLYYTVLYRDACCSCADYRFVERGFLLW